MILSHQAVDLSLEVIRAAGQLIEEAIAIPP